MARFSLLQPTIHEVVMRRAAPAGVLLCGLVSLLAACGGDMPTSIADQPLAESKVHPRGVVDRVEAPSPWGVAVRDDGLAFFTELAHGGVGITNTKTRTVDGFIPTGLTPTGIAFSPDGNTAYVANQFGNVSRIDVATREVTGFVDIASPQALRLSPDGSQLFVGTTGTTVVVVDIATLSIVRTVEVGSAPNGFAVHPNGRLLYVSSFDAGTVSEIDMLTGEVLRTLTPAGQPIGKPQEIALNRKGTRLYVATEDADPAKKNGWLDEYDLATGDLANRITLQAGAFGVGVTPDDTQAYLTLPSAGLIQIFGLQSRKLAKSINVGGDPRRIAFSQKGNIAAVTNFAGFITFIR
jgi:YVTN family beta-propeller protein